MNLVDKDDKEVKIENFQHISKMSGKTTKHFQRTKKVSKC